MGESKPTESQEETKPPDNEQQLSIPSTEKPLCLLKQLPKPNNHKL
jgi:hypothetical protein